VEVLNKVTIMGKKRRDTLRNLTGGVRQKKKVPRWDRTAQERYGIDYRGCGTLEGKGEFMEGGTGEIHCKRGREKKRRRRGDIFVGGQSGSNGVGEGRGVKKELS